MSSYTVRDTKTGKVIKVVKDNVVVKSSSSSSKSSSSGGSSSREIKNGYEVVPIEEAKARAKLDLELVQATERAKSNSSKTSSSNTVIPFSEAQARAKEKLEVVQFKEAQKQAQIKANEINEIRIMTGQSPTSQILQNSGLGFLTKAYTQKQQQQILNRLSNDQNQRLAIIDADRGLSLLEKETEKRKVLGIGISPLEERIKKEKIKNNITKIDFKNLQSNEMKLLNKSITKQTVTPSEIKQLEKIDNSITKKQITGAKYLVNQIYNIPKYFITTNADFVAFGLTGVQKLTEKSIRGVANTIGYFTKRSDILVRQLKQVNGKLYLKPGESIENTLKGDWKKVYKTAENVGLKSWDSYQKGIIKTKSIAEKGGLFIKEHPKETSIIVGTIALSLGNNYLKEFRNNPGKTIGTTLAYIYDVGKVAGKVKNLPKLEKYIFSADELAPSIKLEKQLSQLSSTEKAKALELANPKQFKNLNPREAEQLYKILQAQIEIDSRLRTLAPNKLLSNIKSTQKLSKANITEILSESIPQEVELIKNQLAIINKVPKKIKNKAIKLNPETISRKLGEFYKINEIKVLTKKTMSTSKTQLIKDLIKARKKSGLEFKKLKIKIKKVFGLNVVEKKTKQGITYKLLEPKEQRKLGKLTGKKKSGFVSTTQNNKKTLFIDINKIEKEMSLIEKPLTKPQLDKLEKQMQKELLNFRKKKGLKYNKKAQTNLIQTTRKYYTKVVNRVKRLKSNVQKYKNDYQKIINNRTKKIKGNRKAKFKDLTKTEKKTITKNLSKLKQETKILQKEISSLKSIISNLTKLATLSAFIISNLNAVKNLNSQVSLSEQAISNINTSINQLDFKRPIKPPVKPPRKPQIKKSVKIKPPVKPPIKPPVKPPIKPPVKPPVKPIEDPIRLPKLKFDFNSKLPRGYKRIVDGYVKVGNKRIKVVSNMAENKAWNKVFAKGTKKYNAVDKSTPASFEFRAKGIRKIKDDSRKIGLNKTQPKVNRKNSKTLDVVEKQKNRIDTKGEKQGLKLAKIKKSRNKPKQIKKVKTKTIKKTKKSSKKTSNKITTKKTKKKAIKPKVKKSKRK